MARIIRNYKNCKKKTGHYPGQILQVSGQLALSITTQYDNNSAIIGSNKVYAAIQQLGGNAGKNKKVNIPARPYLNLNEDYYNGILLKIKNYLLWNFNNCFVFITYLTPMWVADNRYAKVAA